MYSVHTIYMLVNFIHSRNSYRTHETSNSQIEEEQELCRNSLTLIGPTNHGRGASSMGNDES